MNGLLLGGIIGEGMKSFVSSYNQTQDRMRQQAEADNDRAERRRSMKLTEKKEGLIWSPEKQEYEFEGGNGSVQQKRKNDALEKQLDNVRQTYSALTEDQKQGTQEGQEMLRTMQALEKRLRGNYSQTYGDVGLDERSLDNTATTQSNVPGLVKAQPTAPQGLVKPERPSQPGLVGGMTPVPGYKSKADRELEKAVNTERAKQLALGTGATELRKEFIGAQAVKDMQNVATAYDKVNKAATNPSAAGDLSLIFAYMKMLDPGSTVREGEFANAQNAAGVPDQILNLYNRARKGERLNDNQRTDFVDQAANVYEAQLGQFNKLKSSYDKIATKQRFDPELVTGAYQFQPPTRKKKESGLLEVVKAPKGMVAVSNGKETLYVTPEDAKEAAKDGYKVMK
jgi:hypothetical protein